MARRQDSSWPAKRLGCVRGRREVRQASCHSIDHSPQHSNPDPPRPAPSLRQNHRCKLNPIPSPQKTQDQRAPCFPQDALLPHASHGIQPLKERSDPTARRTSNINATFLFLQRAANTTSHPITPGRKSLGCSKQSNLSHRGRGDINEIRRARDAWRGERGK